MVLPSPRAILVVGMHRSSTSVATRVFNLLGADLPGNLFPATEENTTGYWESQDIAALNNTILRSLDTAWYDDTPIDSQWFTSPAAVTFQVEICQLLRSNFSNSSLFVIKDPRISRLAPLWIAALKNFGASVSICLCARHPEEVYGSLLARARATSLKTTPITQRERALLLWCRYMLDAEYHSRGLPRFILDYGSLLHGWHELLPAMASRLDVRFPVDLSAAADGIERHLQPALRRQKVDEGIDDPVGRLVVDLYDTLVRHSQEPKVPDTAWLDAVRTNLDNVAKADSPPNPSGRRTVRATSEWTQGVSRALVERTAQLARSPELRHIIFVSGNPEARGHIYRVLHPMAALLTAGCRSSCVGLADVETSLSGLLPADLVVIFRAPWCRATEALFSLCRAHGVPVCFDIDDLVFDREYIVPHYIDYLRLAPLQERAEWIERADAYLRTMQHVDFVTVSTRPLVAAVRKHGKPAYLLPNGFSVEMLACAETVLRERQQVATPHPVRLGYASGTKTHQRDFMQAVPAVVRILNERPETALCLVGEVDVSEFPELAPFKERIETRPLVSHSGLAWEFGRFDINLAPLDVASPFCQGKSEIKYTEAALVEVPTVASATEPFRSAIRANETGFYAKSDGDWYKYLLYLADHPEERKRMGMKGRRRVLAQYGPRNKSQSTLRTYNKALSEFRSNPRLQQGSPFT